MPLVKSSLLLLNFNCTINKQLEPREATKKVLNNIYATIKADLQQDIKNIDIIVNSSQSIEKDYLAIINKTKKKRRL